MSDRALQWSIFLGVPLLIGLTVWVVVNAFQERSDRIESCERVGAEAVGAGRGHYLCVLPDGRIVKP